MEASKRIVNIAFTAGTFLAWWIFAHVFEAVFGALGIRDAGLLGRRFTTTTLLGAAAAVALLFWAWRHPRVRPLAHEAADELTKVTWPSWKEVKTNTRITVVVAIVVAVILWVFDLVFGNLTNLILGGTT
jgi:preprotein translocase subunit SecE